MGTRSTTYSYSSNRLDALRGSTAEHYTYSDDGTVRTRRQGGVTYTLTSDGFGQLTRYARPSRTLATLAYDGDGRRVRKVAGSRTTLYYYDAAGRILAETTANGRVPAEYIYAHGILVAQRNALGQVFYVHTDALGTPQALTDASGQVVWRADYLPFGETHTVSASPPQTKRFLGKTYDARLGLSDLGARLLAHDLGRFLAPDPVRAVDPVSSQERSVLTRNPQRLQLYGYGLNNPYRYVDPDGEIAFVPLIVAAWVVVEAALSAYDAYDTLRTIASPETSTLEKVGAGGLFIAGAVLPGGGYSHLDDVTKQVAKTAAAKFDPSRTHHIFRDAPGHVNPGTAASQDRFAQLFENTASNSANLRADAVQSGIITQEAANAGVQAFTQITRSGEQIWVTVRNGVIQNAGINPTGALR